MKPEKLYRSLAKKRLSPPPPLVSQDGFCEFYQRSAAADHNPSVKTALYAAAGVGLAGLTFLAARKMSTYVLHVLFHVVLSSGNP